MKPKINVALLGCGKWGANILRNLMKIPDVRVVAIAELPAMHEKVRELAKSIGCRARVIDFAFINSVILDDVEPIHAFIIATPANTHAKYIKKCAARSAHIFVEKPICTSCEDALDVLSMTEHLYNYGVGRELKVFMVGHLLVHSHTIKHLRNIIESGVIGDVIHINSSRRNTAGVRADSNVIWDLAVHDVSVLFYLLNAYHGETNYCVKSVCGKGAPLDTVDYTLDINGVSTYSRCSWVAPEQNRNLEVIGTRGRATLSYGEGCEIVQVFDEGEHVIGQYMFKDTVGPLYTELNHFITCIQQGKVPETHDAHGAFIAQVLDQIEKKAGENV